MTATEPQTPNQREQTKMSGKAVRRVKRWLRTKRLQASSWVLLSHSSAARDVEGGRLWATAVQKTLFNFWAEECLCPWGCSAKGGWMQGTHSSNWVATELGNIKFLFTLKILWQPDTMCLLQDTQSLNQTWFCPNKVAASHMGPLNTWKAGNASDQQDF